MAAIAVVLNCAHNAGIEVTNGNCVGTIYNKDSTPASGALVRLIPSDYEPASSPASSPVDSTYTDRYGRYSFDVVESNYYNIIAQKGDVACMQDSVAVVADGKSIVDNDTLEASGQLTGRIQVKPEDDPGSIVILIMGTNFFTTPYDSLGNFVTPPLPAGDFTVKLFTNVNGYDVLDTSITVVSGDTTELTAQLPTTDSPVVSGFTVTFDSVTMMAEMKWTPIDTALLHSYALHRSMTVNDDTLLMLDKTISSYTDDLVLYNGDTVVYELAAVGKNYMEGYKAASHEFVACGKVYCVATTDSGIIPYDYRDHHLVYADSTGNTFWNYKNSIVKLDAGYNKLDEYTIPDLNSVMNVSALAKTANTIFHDDGYRRWDYNDSVALDLSQGIQSDNDNHLYLLLKAADSTDARAPVVIKLDADFDEIGTIVVPRDSNENMCNDLRMVVTGNGTIYLLWTSYLADGTANYIGVYDSDLKFMRKFAVDYTLYEPKCFGDTIVALTYGFTETINYVPSVYTINIFDTSFTFLSSYKAIDPADTYCSPVLCNDNYGNYSQVILMAENMYIATINSVKPTYIFFDFKGNTLARVAVPHSGWCYHVDRFGLYQIGPVYTDDGSTISYDGTIDGNSIMYYMNKYTLAPLFAK